MIFQVLREELLAVQVRLDQIQTEYTRLNPTLVDLQLQLEKEKRQNQHLEDQLMQCKKVQLEMLEAEVQRFDR